MRGVLQLEAREYVGMARWRWVLTDGVSGAFISDHEVRLDESSWQYDAFIDLRHYISWHAAPDRYAQDEARIVAEVGEWIGSEVLGAVADALAQAARKRPVTVRVIVPYGAETLLFRPLELAYARGRPLPSQDITLVMQTASDASADRAAMAGDRLRVLGLFSLPEGGQPLSLRRERHALVHLINRIAARGRAADVHVLQYGVTRDRLRGVLEEAEGWDVIHISGHGAPGELLLETAAGKPDKVTAVELADLLEPARERVKLVTVSACWSAAVTAAQQRRLLGLPLLKDHSCERTDGDSFVPGNLATELVERLDCAVLAMRYPVADEFAIELSEKLYDLLIAKGQPLARAVGMTVKELMAGGRFLALSTATPALFGGYAAKLTLAAPRRTGSPTYRTGQLKMAGFPPEPERFVGRTGIITRVSEALADESGIPGVLLHGMPGGGKTACALELAYTHEHAFDRLVWFKAPDHGMEISGALTDFALALEHCLEGFQMAHLVSDVGKLAAFLPRLTEFMEQKRILVVIDNAESLLADGGQWRDERWGQVFGALTAHRGLGRLIVTSRRVSAEASTLRVEAVDALSADEALLLARELPYLKKLIYGEVPGMDNDVARRLALGVLNVAQGHPKLLELANGHATRPDQLTALVEAGDQAWREQAGLPDRFFSTGETNADPGDYLHVLAAWTKTVTDALSPSERTLFWFLCSLEEPDRGYTLVKNTLADLWEQLDCDGQLPAPDKVLDILAARGLVTIRAETEETDESYIVHPGVAAAGRNSAGKQFRDEVDTLISAYWAAGYLHASEEADDKPPDTWLMVRAGLAAIPYLFRQEQWESAAVLLEEAFTRDPSRENAAAFLPMIKEITSHDPSQSDVLTTILNALDPYAAETEMRTSLLASASKGDYWPAAVTAGKLSYSCMNKGMLDEALSFADQAIEYTKQANAGPWARLGDEVRRLQVLNKMGQAEHVFAEVQRFCSNLPVVRLGPKRQEILRSWNVREALFTAGSDAAMQLGRWDESLKFSAAEIDSKRKRQAPLTDIARTMMGSYGPLIEVGRTEDALDILLECRQIFQDASDIWMLGATLSALADTEHARTHGQAAIKLERDALRYRYLARDITGIALSYNNLGGYLHLHDRQPSQALSCHLISSLIRAITGSVGSADSSQNAAEDLREFGDAAEAPASVADLCRKLGEIPGTNPVDLIAQISLHPEIAERTLRELIATARERVETLPQHSTPA